MPRCAWMSSPSFALSPIMRLHTSTLTMHGPPQSFHNLFPHYGNSGGMNSHKVRVRDYVGNACAGNVFGVSPLCECLLNCFCSSAVQFAATSVPRLGFVGQTSFPRATTDINRWILKLTQFGPQLRTLSSFDTGIANSLPGPL